MLLPAHSDPYWIASGIYRCMPGGAKYDDLPGLLALTAPSRIWLTGEGEKGPPIVKATFAAAGTPENLTVFSSASGDAVKEAIERLLSE